MEINNKKNYLPHIRVYFVMFLFAMCLTMNVLFGSAAYNLYELLDNTAVVRAWETSESIVDNEGGDNTTSPKVSFLDKNKLNHETISKNICPLSIIAAIPKGMSLYLFLIIVTLLFFLTLFIVLPDEWTLVNQKVRLDN